MPSTVLRGKGKKKPEKGWSRPDKRRKRFIPQIPVRDLGNRSREEREILELFSRDSAVAIPTGILQKGGKVVPVDSQMDTTEDDFSTGEPTGSPPERPTPSQSQTGSGGTSNSLPLTLR